MWSGIKNTFGSVVTFLVKTKGKSINKTVKKYYLLQNKVLTNAIKSLKSKILQV